MVTHGCEDESRNRDQDREPLKLWKRILLKVPKVGTAYRAFRWFRFVRKHRLFYNAKQLRKLRRLIRKAQKGGMTKMEGKKTYTGIAITAIGLLLGWLGIGGAEDAQQVVNAGTEAVSAGMQVIGLLVAIYGRYKAKPK